MTIEQSHAGRTEADVGLKMGMTIRRDHERSAEGSSNSARYNRVWGNDRLGNVI